MQRDSINVSFKKNIEVNNGDKSKDQQLEGGANYVKLNSSKAQEIPSFVFSKPSLIMDQAMQFFSIYVISLLGFFRLVKSSDKFSRTLKGEVVLGHRVEFFLFSLPLTVLQVVDRYKNVEIYESAQARNIFSYQLCLVNIVITALSLLHLVFEVAIERIMFRVDNDQIGQSGTSDDIEMEGGDSLDYHEVSGEQRTQITKYLSQRKVVIKILKVSLVSLFVVGVALFAIATPIGTKINAQIYTEELEVRVLELEGITQELERQAQELEAQKEREQNEKYVGDYPNVDSYLSCTEELPNVCN